MNNLDKEGKEIILKRILAKQNGVEVYDVDIYDFTETREGIIVTYLISGDDQRKNVKLTWWQIAMNA